MKRCVIQSVCRLQGTAASPVMLQVGSASDVVKQPPTEWVHINHPKRGEYSLRVPGIDPQLAKENAAQ